jgi:hypothetical protein
MCFAGTIHIKFVAKNRKKPISRLPDDGSRFLFLFNIALLTGRLNNKRAVYIFQGKTTHHNRRDPMLLLRSIILPASLLFVFPSWAADSLDVTPVKVLFVYDTIDKASAFYVETIRENLKKALFQVDEASSGGLRQKDPSQYRHVVIYGMVMAFNLKSSVRRWLKSQKSLENKNVFIFVTANRWFNENLRKDLAKLATKKRATVVDAVSMATNKVNDAEKREKMMALLSQVKK